MSWNEVGAVIESERSVDGNTQVTVAVKLIENLWTRSPGAPRDVRQLLIALRSRDDLDGRAAKIIQAALPPPRSWFPVAGAICAGLALTHLFWVTGLYQLLNDELGRSKGPISVNFVLAVVGAMLCVAAWRTKVIGARMGLVLCTAGAVFTVLDAVKIRWIDVGWLSHS